MKRDLYGMAFAVVAGALIWCLLVAAHSTFAPYPATTEAPCKKN